MLCLHRPHPSVSPCCRLCVTAPRLCVPVSVLPACRLPLSPPPLSLRRRLPLCPHVRHPTFVLLSPLCLRRCRPPILCRRHPCVAAPRLCVAPCLCVTTPCLCVAPYLCITAPCLCIAVSPCVHMCVTPSLCRSPPSVCIIAPPRSVSLPPLCRPPPPSLRHPPSLHPGLCVASLLPPLITTTSVSALPSPPVSTCALIRCGGSVHVTPPLLLLTLYVTRRKPPAMFGMVYFWVLTICPLFSVPLVPDPCF
jgi:hypothetical protein